jgi:hypothetical protein
MEEGGKPAERRAAQHRDMPEPRLLDRMRDALRSRHYSRRTEQAYLLWARRYIVFHNASSSVKRHTVD